MIDFKAAHNASSNHSQSIGLDTLCCCFSCKSVFYGCYIKEWIDDRTTAVCPLCHVDAIIPETSGYPVNDREFIEQMNSHWFAFKTPLDKKECEITEKQFLEMLDDETTLEDFINQHRIVKVTGENNFVLVHPAEFEQLTNMIM